MDSVARSGSAGTSPQQPAPVLPRRPPEVVVMAASGGGLPVLRTIVGGLPPDFPLPVVVVQHRGTTAPGLMAQILARAGPLPARTAQAGDVLVPGTVYVAPPDRHLVLDADRRVTLMDGRRIRFVLSSANPLFQSAAFALGGRVIGVVLTGAGSDGTDGVQTVKGMGGVVIVQDPATAQQSGMPASAIRTGAVDYVVPPEEIAPLLVRLARGREAAGADERDAPPQPVTASGVLDQEGRTEP